MRYSSWKGVYAGHVRRQLNSYERTRPQPRVTVRQYDSHQRVYRPAQKEERFAALPFVAALVAVICGFYAASIPVPEPVQQQAAEQSS